MPPILEQAVHRGGVLLHGLFRDVAVEGLALAVGAESGFFHADEDAPRCVAAGEPYLVVDARGREHLAEHAAHHGLLCDRVLCLCRTMPCIRRLDGRILLEEVAQSL